MKKECENELEKAMGLKELTPIEKFYLKPNVFTFREIPKASQTPELVEFAVAHNGVALQYVSKKLVTKKLCELAVENNGLAIEYVPKEWITPTLAHKAVSCSLHDGLNYPIAYIPDKMITDYMVFKSVQCSPCSIKNVPYRFITKELFLLAVSKDGAALKYVYKNQRDEEVISAAIANQPLALEFVPEGKRTKEVCEKAFNGNPLAIEWIPKEYITHEMCLIVIETFSHNDIMWTAGEIFNAFPNELRNDKEILDALITKVGVRRILEWNERWSQRSYGKTALLSDATVDYLKSKGNRPIISKPDVLKLQTEEMQTPPSPPEATLVNVDDQEQIVHDLTVTDDISTRTVYYITDIHLEHQLKQIASNGELNFTEVREFIKKKLDELIPKEHTIHDILLVGGDVASSFRLTTLFYRELLPSWKGKIISILGNHELWNIQPENRYGEYRLKPLDRIIDEYRKEINLSVFKLRSVLLQNAIYILYKNTQDRVIEENQILDATDEDLRDICSKSSLIILGGIGFSGLDPYYNAEIGLYRSTVTTCEEDMELSKRFYSVYSKLNRCAGNRQVIVLTHTPVYNWTSDPYNPNWVYINGHTHRNSLIRKKNGTTVLSDNQVGYKPTKWKLNGFTVAGWYDPFQGMGDGIHKITSEQYKDFNLGRGIDSKCNYSGELYVLKRSGLYMFLLKSKSSICLLDGGQRKKLYHDVKYYYDNMEQYERNIQEALSPYRQVLKIISQEIKKFGGRGTVHGCIVDINYYCHVYLNPFDGKITPYFAWDTSLQLPYNDISSLLKDRESNLYDQLITAHNNGIIPLLSQYAVTKKDNIREKSLATVPELVLGTEIYKPSKVMRSFQYVLDSNIIRIWKDEILTADFSKLSQNSAIEEKLKQITKK